MPTFYSVDAYIFEMNVRKKVLKWMRTIDLSFFDQIIPCRAI